MGDTTNNHSADVEPEAERQHSSDGTPRQRLGDPRAEAVVGRGVRRKRL
jgi:hypothetical protein